MRSLWIAAAALLVLGTASCGGGGGVYGPSEQDIVNSLEETLRSVAGGWSATATPPNTLQLDFTLQEGGNGRVSGTGTMKEDGATAAIPISMTGTFQRPVLTLAFDGMVYEGRQVQGTIQGSYTTVGGIGATLLLTAPGYSRQIPLLMHEK